MFSYERNFITKQQSMPSPQIATGKEQAQQENRLFLENLVYKLALDSIEVQKIWNTAFEKEEKLFRKMPINLVKEIPDSLKLPPPASLLLKDYHFKLDCRLETRKSKGFEIEFIPLNMNYFVRHQTQQETESRIEFHVQQIPLGTTENISTEENHVR